MNAPKVHTVSGCSKEMLDYIAEQHAFSREDGTGFPQVYVADYFSEDMPLDTDVDQEAIWETDILNAMNEGQAAGADFVVFVD